MGKMKQTQHTKYDGVPNRDEGIRSPQHKAIDELLGKHGVVVGYAISGVPTAGLSFEQLSV